MWIRATPDETFKSRQRESKHNRIAIVLGWLALTLLTSSMDGGRSRHPAEFVSLSEFYSRLPFNGILLAIGFFVGSKFLDKRRWMICLRCGTPKMVRRNEICCGDTLVELVEAKWIEDEKEPGCVTNPGYPLIG